MASVKAIIGKHHYQTVVNAADNNSLLADEPAEKGGQGTGMNPSELLLASLSSCIAITARMYADRKAWALESVEVEAEYSNETFHIVKKFNGNLSSEQIQRLQEISDRCPIHKILTKENTIHSEVI